MDKNIGRQDKSPVTRFYDALAPVYAGLRDIGHRRDGDQKNRLINTLKPFTDDIILDIGTGPGIYALEIAKNAPSCRVCAIDISESFIKIAAARAEEAGVTNIVFSVDNVESLTFPDESFTKIICAGVISVIKNRPKAVSEIARILRPGGRLLLREPRRSDSLLAQYARRLPEKSPIRKAISRFGLMFGHFSPDFMTEDELMQLFKPQGFSRLTLEKSGPDLIFSALK